MQPARDICETVYANGAAVLMARVVDGAGVSVRRDGVARIRYSIREIDPCDSERREDVAGHVDVPLEVDRVFSDELQTGGLWDVDRAGYNFRHEMGGGHGGTFPKPGRRYEIRYELLFRERGAAAILFHVRFNPNERR